MTVGSDEEAALIKAICCAFPSVQLVACTRHLRQNADCKLDRLIGSRQLSRRTVHDDLFGDDGLVTCTDIVALDEAADRLKSGSLQSMPATFQQYV